MEFQLELVEKNDFVVAVLGGVRTPDTLMAAAAKTTAYCREHGYSHLLIDLRNMHGGLDTVETFEVAGHAIPTQTDARGLVCSAILDLTENIERIRFFETVAVNRGFNVKVFDDEDQAVQWLLKE